MSEPSSSFHRHRNARRKGIGRAAALLALLVGCDGSAASDEPSGPGVADSGSPTASGSNEDGGGGGGQGIGTDAGAETDAGKPRVLGFTPWVLLDAEGGTVGERHQWSDADGRTVVDTTHVFEGSASFKMHAIKGKPGTGQFGNWGGVKTLPTKLAKGEVLHVQFAAFFPTTFDWTADPWLKFIRLHVQTSNRSNVGYHDLYIYNNGTIHNIYEGVNIWKKTAASVQKDEWNVLEFEVTLDDEAVDDGGKGRTRVWQKQGSKMVLSLDRTDVRTLNAPSDTLDRVHLFTYWNSKNEDGRYPTQAQDCWIDRVVMEKDLSKLVEQDDEGNKIIGGL